MIARNAMGVMGGAAAVALLVSGCGREKPAPPPTQTPLLPNIEQAVVWKGEVALEENQRVINVSPAVSPDVGGMYLVSDALEQQIRIYGPEGRLRSTFGRRGSGPGEFQHLNSVVRLPDGTVLAADMGGEITHFDSTGTRVTSTSRSGLGPLYRIVPVDDSTVVLVGRKAGRMSTPLVHVWDVRGRRILRSLYPAPQGPPGFASSYAVNGFADVAVRGDTLAVLFALEDTVHLFDRRGRALGKVPVPYRAFRPMREPLPEHASPAAIERWEQSFSSSTNLFWLRDGSFLVQYLDQKNSDRSFGLLRMTRRGGGDWEVAGSPRLLAVRPEGLLVFVKPGAEAPNRWSLAEFSATR
jgi:hypothetical protein